MSNHTKSIMPDVHFNFPKFSKENKDASLSDTETIVDFSDEPAAVDVDFRIEQELKDWGGKGTVVQLLGEVELELCLDTFQLEFLNEGRKTVIPDGEKVIYVTLDLAKLEVNYAPGKYGQVTVDDLWIEIDLKTGKELHGVVNYKKSQAEVTR